MRRFTALAATLFTLPLAVHAATQTFTSTGAEQDFVVPAGVMATIPVTSGESLAIFVGGAGGPACSPRMMAN